MASVTNTHLCCCSTKSVIGQPYILKKAVSKKKNLWACSRLQPSTPYRYMRLGGMWFIDHKPCDMRRS